MAPRSTAAFPRTVENEFSAASLLLGMVGTLYGSTVGSSGNAGMVFELTESQFSK